MNIHTSKGTYNMNMYGMEDEFFTREEINELADEVESQLNDTEDYDRYRYTEVYIENNELDISVLDTKTDYEYNTKMKVDMRRIKKPSDLMKYASKLADVFLKEFSSYEEELRSYGAFDDIESATNTCGIAAVPKVLEEDYEE